VYVKGLEKREWLTDILDDAGNGYIIDTLDADYEDIDSLNKLDITNIVCDVENMLRIAHYKMYSNYLTGGRNARKNCKKNKICKH